MNPPMSIQDVPNPLPPYQPIIVVSSPVAVQLLPLSARQPKVSRAQPRRFDEGCP